MKMVASKKLSLILASLVGASVFVYLFIENWSDHQHLMDVDSLKIGSDAPQLINQASNTIIDGLEGKKVVLFFFSPECSSCLTEAPLWFEIYQKRSRDKNLFMLGICPVSDSVALGEFQQKTKSVFSVLFDHENTLLKKYRVKKYPTVILVDDKGKIAFTSDAYPLDLGLSKFNQVL